MGGCLDVVTVSGQWLGAHESVAYNQERVPPPDEFPRCYFTTLFATLRAIQPHHIEGQRL